MPGPSVQRASLAGPAPSTPPAGAALLGFAAGGKRWLIDPRQDVQVIDAAITPVPLTQPWYLGLVLLGQRLIAAIDLAGLGGAEVVARKPVERLLLLPERWQTALRVERVYGLRDAAGLIVNDANDANDWNDVNNADARPVTAPSALHVTPPWRGPMLADADGQQWQVLDLAQLCTSPAFLRAGNLVSA